MLNLALMTLHESSLERRIRVMHPGKRAHPALLMLGAVAAIALLAVACASSAPNLPEQVAVVAVDSPARQQLPSAEDLRVSPDSMIQRAAVRVYGDRMPANAGSPARLWMLLNRDWSVREHGEGPEGLVESVMLTASDSAWAQGRPVYTVRESVEKRFAITINDSKVVSHYGGSHAVLGGDTAWVFYARYAQ